MSKWAGLTGVQTAGIAVAAGAAVIGGVLYVAGVFDQPEPQADPPASREAAPEASPEPDTAEAAPDPEPETEPADAAPEAAPETGTAEAASDAETGSDPDTATQAEVPDATAEPPAPPEISTFRLDPDGRMLLAGKGQPGWEVSILLDDKVLSRVSPDANGEFVQFHDLEPSDAPRVLSLAMRPPEGGDRIVSDDEIIIAPMPRRMAADDGAPPAQPEPAEDSDMPAAAEGSTGQQSGDTAEIARAGDQPATAGEETGAADAEQRDTAAVQDDEAATRDGAGTTDSAASADAAAPEVTTAEPESPAPAEAATADLDMPAPADPAPETDNPGTPAVGNGARQAVEADTSPPADVAAETGSEDMAERDTAEVEDDTAPEVTTAEPESPAPAEVATADLDVPAPADPAPKADSPGTPAVGNGAREAVEADTGPPADVAAETGAEDMATRDTAAVEPGAPAPVDAADPARPAPEEPAEPGGSQAVLLSDEEGVRVVQPPEPRDAGPEVMSIVALDAITYSEEGEVELSGRAPGDGFVRVYLDNKPITTSRIEEDGNWRSELPEVDTGVYTLRIDEVDEEGNVTSRVETPFKREDRGLLTGQDGDRKIRAITVQPGNTLWAISREKYGEGVLYVRIFEANRERIRDPDLIYPGQVFTVPQ